MFDQWRTLRGGEAGFQLPTVEINTHKNFEVIQLAGELFL